MTYNYSATQNNGRIASSVDGVTGENTTYSYDALNRLTNASNSLWSEAYTYDGFGNLTSKTGSGGSPNPAPTVSMTYNSKNQPTNIYYDANGNQNACNSPQCGNSYSVENRMTLEVLGSYPYPANIYAYDPWGKRVMSGYNPNYYSPKPNYSYTFYGVTGQKLATVTCNGSNYPAYPTCAIVGQNVYFGKKLITAGGVNVVTDRLGSVRANGQGESFAYYPYGEERTNRPDGREKFGTYFRDAIGQDYADQRYYGSGTGSFFTPDPRGGNTGNPTSLNKYLYVRGDPTNFNDPRGLDPNCGPGMSWGGEGCTQGTTLNGAAGTADCWSLSIWTGARHHPGGGGGGGGGSGCGGGTGLLEARDPNPGCEVPGPSELASPICTLTFNYRGIALPVVGILAAHGYLHFTSTAGTDVIIEGYDDDSGHLRAWVDPHGLPDDDPGLDKTAGSISGTYVCGWITTLEADVTAINGANITYDRTGPNSNSALAYMLSTLPNTTSSWYKVPSGLVGWNKRLPGIE